MLDMLGNRPCTFHRSMWQIPDFAERTRNPIRNRVIVLLSAKAGRRAGEIANLTWDMVVDAGGQISNVIELRDHAAKKGSGRLIPMHAGLAEALSVWRQTSSGSGHVVRSVRGGRDRVGIAFGSREHRTIGLEGCSSIPAAEHSLPGRPGSFITSVGPARRANPCRPQIDPDDRAIHRRRH